MSRLCMIEGCPGNTRDKKRGEKIYLFKALEDQLEEWRRVIPGNCKINLHDRVCSRHFKDDDLIKEWNFVIDDRTVTMPRGRWTLRVGAVPEKFDNYNNDDIRVRLGRKSKPKSLVEPAGSTSDEEYEVPRRKRAKKLKLKHSPKVAKKSVKQVSKTPKPDHKSRRRSSEKTSKEPCGKSANQAAEVSWEKVCDNFVDQLSSICSQTPANELDAKPAKRRRGRPCKNERRPSVGRPRTSERRRRVGRPRKNERRSKVGRPRKDKQSSSSVSKTPSLHKNSTTLKREKSISSGGGLDVENDNSVIVEEFVATSCDDTADVEILNPDSSSQITITECLVPFRVTVKTEECNEGYEHCNSVTNNRLDSCIVTSSSEDLTIGHVQTLQENEWNYEGVTVKREMCDCAGGDSRCCEPQPNCDQTVLELPATPIPYEETNQPPHEQADNIYCGLYSPCSEIEIDENGRTNEIKMPEISIIPVSRLVHEVPRQPATNEIDCELVPTPHLDCKEQESQVSDNPPEVRVILESQAEPTFDATQCGSTGTTNPRLGCEELALQRIAPETGMEEELPETSKNQPKDAGRSDFETDFLGFPSDEEEDLVLKREHFQNTAEMAAKSAKLYMSKLTKVCKSNADITPSESDELSPRPRRPAGRKRKSSVEIAMNQLNNLESILPVRSKNPAGLEKKTLVKDSVWKIQQPSVQEGKVSNIPDSSKERIAPNFKCDEVLKCGRISAEVTVTKASNLNQRLDKVTSALNVGQGLDKVTSSSTHILLNDKSNIKTYSSPRSKLISNKVTNPSNHDRLKDKITTPSSNGMLKDKIETFSNHSVLRDKMTPSLSHLQVKDKVTISSTQESATDRCTSAIENKPLKDKIHTTPIGPTTDRLCHLLNGSSLDRILESSKSSSLLDSVTSTSICNPTVDKTSLILKNFKSDGVLALECVVLKEQVRQLQKELFLHKQMLIESEHNASLLQRKLELQAQLPCAKCANFKRGFIGKETLI